MVAQPPDSMAIELPSTAAIAPNAVENVPESAPEGTPNVLHLIQSQIQALPLERQQEVLDFVEFLVQRNQPPEPEKTIWEDIDDLMAQVPDEALEQVPTDGSYQHDHYLYGSPKRAL
jgi:Protein of unknown function (DUF2281)